MDRRGQILGNIRRQVVQGPTLPDNTGPWTQYADPWQQFSDVLASVGGTAHRVPDHGELERRILELPACATAKLRSSQIPLGGDWNVRLDDLDDPHRLAPLDFAVLQGQFSVAENAAIWVTDRGLRHRAVYFIVQHLAIVVPAGEIVHNMHEAYARLSLGEAGFGCFLSGPSKTADIEQSLVIGAHGARSLQVFILG